MNLPADGRPFVGKCADEHQERPPANLFVGKQSALPGAQDSQRGCAPESKWFTQRLPSFVKLLLRRLPQLVDTSGVTLQSLVEEQRHAHPFHRIIVVLMSDGLTRLTEPFVREGGRLRPASWEEALTRAAAGLAAARDKGPNTFGM